MARGMQKGSGVRHSFRKDQGLDHGLELYLKNQGKEKMNKTLGLGGSYRTKYRII